MAEKSSHNGLQRSTSFPLKRRVLITHLLLMEHFLFKVSSIFSRLDLKDYELPIPLIKCEPDNAFISPIWKGNDSINWKRVIMGFQWMVL